MKRHVLNLSHGHYLIGGHTNSVMFVLLIKILIEATGHVASAILGSCNLRIVLLMTLLFNDLSPPPGPKDKVTP